MNKNYKKYLLIAICVMMIVVIVVVVYSMRNSNITYTNVTPKALEFNEKDIYSTDVQMVINDKGCVQNIYFDGEYVYYVNTPDNEYGLICELAYLKRVSLVTGNTEIVHEFSDMGEFEIGQIVYGDEYLFIEFINCVGDYTDSILKMSKEDWSIDVVYERVRGIDNGDFRLWHLNSNYMSEYLIWSEAYNGHYDTKYKYNLYDIEKNEITEYKNNRDNGIYRTPSISNNTLMYGDTYRRKNVLVCEEINGDKKVRMELGAENFGCGFMYNDWLVWVDEQKRGLENHVYLFDFYAGEKFLIDSDVWGVSSYANYIVTESQEQVAFIDYVNRERINYKIGENQKFVNVIDGVVVFAQSLESGGVEIVFGEVEGLGD